MIPPQGPKGMAGCRPTRTIEVDPLGYRWIQVDTTGYKLCIQLYSLDTSGYMWIQVDTSIVSNCIHWIHVVGVQS